MHTLHFQGGHTCITSPLLTEISSSLKAVKSARTFTNVPGGRDTLHSPYKANQNISSANISKQHVTILKTVLYTTTTPLQWKKILSSRARRGNEDVGNCTIIEHILIYYYSNTCQPYNEVKLVFHSKQFLIKCIF